MVTQRASLVLSLTLLAAGAGAPAENRDPLLREERLARPALIRAEGTPVSDLLQAVGAKTGVKLSARGPVGDEKVVVLGPRRPVRETLADVAALLNATWRPSTRGGEREWVLEQGPAATALEERLVRASAARLQAQVDEHARALQETPEQLARRPENDLSRRLLEEPRFRQATEFYTLLSPAQKEALFLRRRLNVAFGALTQAQQGAVREMWDQAIQAERAFAASPEGMAAGHRVERRREDVQRGFLRMRVQRMGGHALVVLYLGGFPARSEVQTGEGGQTGFASSGWPIFLVRGGDGWLLPAHGNPYTGRETPNPTAARPVTPGRDWVETLRRLAEVTQQPVVADFYRSRALNAPEEAVRDAAAPPETAALDRLCHAPGYLWWSADGTLFLRKRDWFEQRRYEVPDRWLSETARSLSRSGGASARDVASLLRLSVEQTEGLWGMGESPNLTFPEEIHPARVLMRMVELGGTGGRLFPTALEAGALPGPWLAAARMTPPQQRLFPTFAAEADNAAPETLGQFRAWVTTRPAESPGGDRSLALELVWSFGAAEGRSSRVKLLLPLVPPDERSRPSVEL